MRLFLLIFLQHEVLKKDAACFKNCNQYKIQRRADPSHQTQSSMNLSMYISLLSTEINQVNGTWLAWGKMVIERTHPC